jgi:hypothetical protein
MKKKLTILFVAIIFVFTLSSANINAKEKNEAMIPKKTVLVEKVYDNWDEAKYAGEYIVDENVGLVKFRRASRIGDTEKFIVTYASVSDEKKNKN